MAFSFFNKKITPDLSFLGADMHSHLLPGLDDGLQKIDQTIAFVKELHALGYQKLICTPHILTGVHNNSPETILPVLTRVREALTAYNIPVTIEAGAEYMVDDSFEELLKSGKPLLTFGKNNLLIEMSYMAASPNLFDAIFQLELRGIKPIFAHPERYSYYHQSFDQYEEIKNRGVYFQVNILSLSGYYGKDVKKVGEKLIERGMVEFIGTDMHHTNHLQATRDFISSKSFYDMVERIPLLNSSLLD